MKFYLVPIGEQFKYLNKIYTKAGPLTASAEEDGKNKLLPRSANVELLSTAHLSEDPSENKKSVSTATIINAVNIYHHHCTGSLEKIKADIDEKMFIEMKDQLEDAYKKLIYTIQ